MSAITPFQFPATGQTVRTVTIDGEPWFVGRDVALTLGYTNPAKAVRDHVPAGHRGGNESFTPSDLGLDPQTVLISEPGMYRLIMRSNTELAEPFQEWVTAEVLPAIRRTGSYTAPQQIPSHAESLRGWAAEVERREAAEARVTELEPAAAAWNALAEAKGDYSLREAAQILSRDPLINTGQNRLAAYLREIGWVDSTKQPYQSQVNVGRLDRRPRDYFDRAAGEMKTTTQIRITVKGLKELRARMAGQCQLVVIEGGA